MKHSILKLQSDVMARLGEIARPQSQSSASSSAVDVPWPEDIIGLKARSLLPEVGGSLIREAPLPLLDCGASHSPGTPEVYAMRRMPCGLYGAEVRLPGGFLRLVSVKMSDWGRSAVSVVLPESSGWNRQWSVESGIAGCPDRPRAYVDSDGGGILLRLMGSGSEDAALEWLNVWSVPEIDSSGEFDFPETLYPDLVAGISGRLIKE